MLLLVVSELYIERLHLIRTVQARLDKLTRLCTFHELSIQHYL
ncbi:hypothetical protein DAI22_01g466700 [Oryza sativa Japonica Group]|nr:hypothetical protein DAI22_01g466700 [Oryza sativa Japonica Group]